MLYIMRHGRTDWNERNKLQGRTDIPLNAAGRKMAEEAAAVYKMCRLMYAIVLHWQEQDRRQRYFKNRNIPIITDDRLVEMSFGIYEGTEQSARALDCPINILFKEPESIRQLKVGKALRSYLKEQVTFLEM